MTLGSFRKFQADDYLMVLVLCFYTTLISTINIVSDTSSNLLPPGFDVNSLTPQDVKERQYGSKLILVVEQCQCVTIWGAKGCLIILYLRITNMRGENFAIKCLAAFVVASFIVMDSLYFAYWCQPFNHYWAVPTPNRQCDTATNHLIMNAAFNLASDCAMMAIGLPMFLRLHLAWKKKIPLVGIFSLGLFTILAAILNKVYSFSEPFGEEWTHWYTRESSTALLCANLPFVWTFWRSIVRKGSITGQSRHPSDSPSTALGRDDKSERKQTGGTLHSSTAADYRYPPVSPGQLEMQEGVRADMTFEEMLMAEPLETDGARDPTPFTHPALFYSKDQGSQGSEIRTPMKKAVLKDSPERTPARRDSSPDDPPRDTPPSSVLPILRSEESANSLV
ncbi:hypothetical protein LTR37_009576 [Vermiconidia calcicola]|uniref:Uncharacterized protein n=1 Tax=Vermiconidia calcicola TaxID=1690605 RepID=A0ACC3N7X4_9PEZI|nr:hypothetical protein LTR37_009576 [Vermiconidia calcicola]